MPRHEMERRFDAFDLLKDREKLVHLSKRFSENRFLYECPFQYALSLHGNQR